MATTLSSRITKHFAITKDARRTASTLKVALHTVRDAVYAWRVVETLGPLLKGADEIIREIDCLGPPGEFMEGIGGRIREERKRHRITLREAAATAGIPPAALGAIERGKVGAYGGKNAWNIAYDLKDRYADFDDDYVTSGKRGAS